MNFDPNNIAIANNNIFGYPYNLNQSNIVLIPIPWDVTTSYKAGTALGPQSILKASTQLDFFDFDIPNVWENKIYMLPTPIDWENTNIGLRQKAERYLHAIESGINIDSNPELSEILNNINKASIRLNEYVEEISTKYLNQDKLVGIIGGEHSVPYGFIKALCHKHHEFGILHIDAHADLRNAYENFEYSHASIMFNVMKLKQVNKIVQVGIRDFCNDEYQLIRSSNKLATFFDEQIKEKQFNGILWDKICEDIIQQLPNKVYISFDIDGLKPHYCPNTGTPVPGGLEFNEATYLIRKLAKSGKKIIGFDLTEVAPGDNEWDGNVGARLCFLLSNMMMLSNQ